jgi:hypothetical protein
MSGKKFDSDQAEPIMRLSSPTNDVQDERQSTANEKTSPSVFPKNCSIAIARLLSFELRSVVK